MLQYSSSGSGQNTDPWRCCPLAEACIHCDGAPGVCSRADEPRGQSQKSCYPQLVAFGAFLPPHPVRGTLQMVRHWIPSGSPRMAVAAATHSRDETPPSRGCESGWPSRLAECSSELPLRLLLVAATRPCSGAATSAPWQTAAFFWTWGCVQGRTCRRRRRRWTCCNGCTERRGRT